MKVIALTLLALVALQSVSASSAPKKQHPILYRHGQRWDPVQEVEDAIASLVETIVGAIESAKGEVTQLLAEVDLYYELLKIATQNEINQLVEDAVAEIAGAVDVPEDVLQACVDESGIAEIPVHLIEDLIACVTDKIAEAVALVDDIILNVDNAINIVSTFGPRLDDCGWSVGCYADLLWDIGVAAVEIPINITMDVAKVTELVLNLQTDLETCALLQLAEAGVLIAVDVAEIIICTENAGK